MSEWTEIDYEELARKRPTQYLKKKAQISDLFAAMAVWSNPIEQAALYIWESYNIYNATGVELDRFGEYVNTSRNGDDDDAYRERILASKLASSSSGTPPDVYGATEFITGANSMFVTERYCAAYNMHINDNVVIPENMSSLLDSYSAAGVSTQHTFSRGMGKSFLFAGITDEVTLIGIGGTDSAVGVNDGMAIRINDTSAMGDENLTGVHADTVYFAIGINGTNTALGQNGNDGYAIGVNGSRPSGEIWDRGIYLAGTYG